MKCMIFFVCLAFLFGKMSASLRSRIIGGKTADIKDFPYQASLRIENIVVCGACIVSDRHVLTAAHCITLNKRIVAPYPDVSVNTGTGSSKETGHVHRIATVTIHPDYMGTLRTSFANDIAVITLVDKIDFNEKQQKIKLASRNSFTGMEAVIAGWGRTSVSTVELSVQLQMLKVKVLDSIDCQLKNTYTIVREQLCAFYKIRYGPCFGDSGDPLVANDEIVGIASWVFDGTCATGIPDVYTNVYAYRDFIESVINNTYFGERSMFRQLVQMFSTT